MPEIHLQSFTRLKSYDAESIITAVRDTAASLAIDFPGLTERYHNHAAARASIERAQTAATLGELGAFAVRDEGERFLGIVSYAPGRLYRSRLPGPTRKVEVVGPMIAMWLRETERPRRLGAQVIEALAGEMLADARLCGQPWAVVRPENGPAMSLAEQLGKEFPEWPVEQRETRWWPVEGLPRARRALFVATRTLEDMRDELSDA